MKFAKTSHFPHYALSKLETPSDNELSLVMVIIRFEDPKAEKQALGWLAGRFSFKTWANGDLMLPENALPFLAREGIQFKVEGPATYEHAIPSVRTSDPAPVK